MNQKIIGSFAPVTLPDFGDIEVVAKVDTGAYSGAVHCEDISVVERDGTRFLKFRPYSHENPEIETSAFHERFVRSSTGHRVSRYLIDTTILIDGVEYPIAIGLSDRSELKFQVLLGRRFLREQNILVDTRINQHLDKDGELANL